MLKVKRFVCNPLQENTYVVSDETLDCVIIDCGAFSETEAKAIVGYIEENQLKPRHLICTHGHFDHVMGNGFMYEMLGLKPEYSELEQPLIGHVPPFIAPFLGTVSPDSVPPAQCYLDKDSIITFGSHRFEVQQTPGHSAGSLIFYCKEEKMAFSGDTLFRMSIGRTDFPESDSVDMEQSLRNVILQLPDDTVVYPGHGPETIMLEERQYNPYLSYLK